MKFTLVFFIYTDKIITSRSNKTSKIDTSAYKAPIDTETVARYKYSSSKPLQESLHRASLARVQG